MEAFVRDRYDSINFWDPGPGFPSSSGKEQFVAVYVHDFRYPLATNACELGNWVSAVQFVTGSRKVDLVGHSRGNLVIKEYLNNHPETVAEAVLIAPPNLGSPKTLKLLRYGDKLDEALINECYAKRAAHNMPGIFNMLPGERWFDVAGPYFTDRTQGTGTRIVNFDDMLNYLRFGKESSDICPMNKRSDVGPYDT
jgi:pimeloyl-ACP methyl ester carboxylesterase